MRIAIDTNILVYALGLDEEAGKRARAAAILDAIPPDDLVVPTQVLGELYNVLTRKGRFERSLAGTATLKVLQVAEVVAHEPTTFRDAISLAVRHELQVWDALIVAIAAAEDCDLLLSEDMHDSFRYLGVEVVNPFRDPPDHRVLTLLEPRP